MAKKTDESAALAKPEQVSMAEGVEMPGDWLSDVLGDDDVDVTGTEEMGAEDVRLPTWLLNSKKEDASTGRACPEDVFWNTVTETGKERLRLVILSNHKSRIWREEDANNELVIRCRSWDTVEGETDSGERRRCAGCPDYQWRTDEKGKRFRRCTDVHNILAMDRETREIGVLKVKTTAIRGWRDYYQQFFHKKRAKKVVDPKTGKTKTAIVDVPFFAAETVVEAMKKTGGGFTWYVPRFAFGGALEKTEILAAAELVKGYLFEYLDRASKTHDDDAAPAVEGSGDVIDAAEFSDDDDGASAAESGRF